MQALQVYIVDDDDDVRDAVAGMLASEGMAVVSFASAERFLQDFDPTNCGCIVLDVRMPGISGLDLLEQLKGVHDIPVVMLTGHADVPLAIRAFRSGAIDFVEKPFDEDDLINRIRKAIARRVPAKFTASQRDAVLKGLLGLTEREREILDKIVEGLHVKQIAAELGTSHHTVRNQRVKLLQKMNAKTDADLVQLMMVARYGQDG